MERADGPFMVDARRDEDAKYGLGLRHRRQPSSR